jgi:RNA polymerase sigma factor (sigma-70 family)
MNGAEPVSAAPTTLLARIRDPRDATSWREFADVYSPLIYAYGRRKHLQDADAADLVQDVLAEVARCMPTFEVRPERGTFRDWLGTLTYRRLGKLLGQRARAAALGSVGGQADAGPAVARPADPEWTDEFNSHVLCLALERARSAFEAATWLAFELCWLRGRPAPQVAAELGMTVTAVYVAKSRVLKRVEEEARNVAEDFPHLVPLG